ncbi:hypothetical protein H6F46_03600 [Limnothrix sp. FACHB-1083]|nr:hypothetical protein [Limnothrix sp. FACHB-1083]MBD2159775.1 hypothetical protein [Limnothrix sp. FACHB-1083]
MRNHSIGVTSQSSGQKFLFVEHAIEKTRFALKRCGDPASVQANRP